MTFGFVIIILSLCYCIFHITILVVDIIKDWRKKKMTKEYNCMGLNIQKGLKMIPITVRVTSDKHGQTLSLADDSAGAMISVPLEQLKGIIEYVDVDKSTTS